jgi:hypothetical protein
MRKTSGFRTVTLACGLLACGALACDSDNPDVFDAGPDVLHYPEATDTGEDVLADVTPEAAGDADVLPDPAGEEVTVEVAETVEAEVVAEAVEEVGEEVAEIEVVEEVPAEAEVGETAEPWPPSTPWYTDTACNLPACDTGATLPFDFSGNWTLTTTTKSTDCNALVQTADPRFAVGYVHTGSAHELKFTGTCDYLPDGTTQMGTFKDAVEITCQVQDRPLGAKSLEVGVMTFTNDGAASGTATVRLFDLPAEAGQAGNACTIEMDVTMARQ